MARPFNDRDLDEDFYSDDDDLQDIINQYGDNDGENEATPW